MYLFRTSVPLPNFSASSECITGPPFFFTLSEPQTIFLPHLSCITRKKCEHVNWKARLFLRQSQGDSYRSHADEDLNYFKAKWI
jgi:hypothetical protein